MDVQHSDVLAFVTGYWLQWSCDCKHNETAVAAEAA
jgi:hypothetical protein